MINLNHIAGVGKMVAALAVVALVGCTPARVTREKIVGADIVIEWPERIQSGDVTTVEVDGHILSVARPAPVPLVQEPEGTAPRIP